MKSSLAFKQKISKFSKKINWTGYLLIAPVVIGTLVVIIYPILRTVWMSFFDYVLSKPTEIPFIGLKIMRNCFPIRFFWIPQKLHLSTLSPR